MKLMEELLWRGLIMNSTEGTLEHLSSGKRTFYIGFDPTAPSLHVGSLLPLITMRRLHDYGHTPIALVGGGTGAIGDPSFKASDRKRLTADELAENIQKIRAQVSKFVDTEEASSKIVNNQEWLTDVGLMSFLQEVGIHFSVSQMLAKESVKQRMNQEAGLSYAALSYMLLQGYDFLHLYDAHGCTVQAGGSDQWGNITIGIDLIRRVRRIRTYGFVLPLITTSSGVKFGKTEVGTVWLDPQLTTPFAFYQFWINVSDDDVVRYLKFFTSLGEEEIDALERKTETSAADRNAQAVLAKELTTLLHGNEEFRKAEMASRLLFGLDGSDVTEEGIDVLTRNVPTLDVRQAEFLPEGIQLSNLVARTGLVSSRSEAHRLIKGGGLYLNHKRIDDPACRVLVDDAIRKTLLILRKGRKDFHLIRVTSSE